MMMSLKFGKVNTSLKTHHTVKNLRRNTSNKTNYPKWKQGYIGEILKRKLYDPLYG